VIRLAGKYLFLELFFKQMSNASTAIPRGPDRRDRLHIGSHVAYVFDSSAEKQSKLFGLCRETMDARNSSLLYIAGKQGVKGIRLSLKDTGFDVVFYERNKQLRIVDSEEWYLVSSRDQQRQEFSSISELEEKFRAKAAEAIQSGFTFLTVISETDMLVRKGFLTKYGEFDEFLGKEIKQLALAVVCAFDKRELEVAGIQDVNAAVLTTHSRLV
jgi:MEDS: MEthanogen/methylotroph, DcmR Sensory domain